MMTTPNKTLAGRPPFLPAAILALLSLTSVAQASTIEAPPPGDILGRYMVHRARLEGHAIHLEDNAQTRVRFLADSTSPTGDLDLSFLRLDGEAWYSARDHMYREETRMTQQSASYALAWDYGMTKASHGWEVPRTANWRSVGYLAQANAKKAGVDEDVFAAARRIMQADRAALPASYAVAAMLLREKQSFMRDDAMRRARGLDDAILRRFLAAKGPEGIQAGDAVYLMTVLEGELNRWHAGGVSVHGARQLPVVFRLARAAAAYKEDRDYAKLSACTSTKEGRWAASGDGSAEVASRPCLVDYTDQDLYRWYQRQYSLEMPGRGQAGRYQNLIDAMRLVHPLWVPAHRPWAISEGATVEVLQHIALRSEELDPRSEQADEVLTQRARAVVMGVNRP
jgi:hypothetical protein